MIAHCCQEFSVLQCVIAGYEDLERERERWASIMYDPISVISFQLSATVFISGEHFISKLVVFAWLWSFKSQGTFLAKYMCVSVYQDLDSSFLSLRQSDLNIFLPAFICISINLDHSMQMFTHQFNLNCLQIILRCQCKPVVTTY